ncbi:MAG TPA: DUF881 domain-containing protein [Beutenbergiaceae bacterium]|nr:DUF881 domain-containing protein [Beutenbergiaceae bacterium]
MTEPHPSSPRPDGEEASPGPTPPDTGPDRAHSEVEQRESPVGTEPNRRSKTERTPISLRSQILIGAICVVLGFAIVTQVRQTADDEFATMRQDDLIELLDEVTQRNEDLTDEGADLRRDRNALQSGSDAHRIAEEYQLVLGVLAGTEPVEGPGVVVTIAEGEDVTATVMVHMLEELRNAGAEAVEVSGARLTGSSAFSDTEDGVLADGAPVGGSMEWRAIGNPQTMAVALDIPGGALASFRNVGAVVEVEQRDLVQITSIRQVGEAEYASPREGQG